MRYSSVFIICSVVVLVKSGYCIEVIGNRVRRPVMPFFSAWRALHFSAVWACRPVSRHCDCCVPAALL